MIHQEIDNSIQEEKKWVKRIKNAYNVVECVAAALCFCFFPIFDYFWIHKDSQKSAAIIDGVLASVGLVIGFIFIGSSVYLVRFVKNTTGKKPNLCLLLWHSLNTSLLTAIMFVQAFFVFKYDNL